MIYAKLTITIEINDNMLTKEQQKQAKKADSDINIKHPLEEGIDRLTDDINDNAIVRYFDYLNDGCCAIDLTIND